ILEGFERDVPLSDNTFLMGLPAKELAELILSKDPAVVGFSVLFVNQLDCALETAKILRKEKTDLFLLWGGPIVTLKPEKFASLPEVDGFILGEADISGPHFLEIVSKEGREGKLPPGTGMRRNDRFDVDISFQPVNKLDELPLPAREL